MHYHTQINEYRILPPKCRIVYPEDWLKSPEEKYLNALDSTFTDAERRTSYRDTSDLVSLVFSNQALTHELGSRHLAQLLSERNTLAQRHLEQIHDELEELKLRLPPHGGYLNRPQADRLQQELERRILDLERQKRDVELALWKDTVELRRELVSERQEYRSTARRMAFLSGGTDGRS